MALSVAGIGPVCALGSGIQSFEDGIQGKIQPNIEQVLLKNVPEETYLPVYKAVVEGLDTYINKRALRRVDAFAKMALLATHLAIEDSGLALEDKSRVAAVVGSGYGPVRTTFGFLDCIIDDGDRGASPTFFANSVHNFLASQISIFLKITGPCTTITCFDHTVSNVFLTAEHWLDQGLADYVIAGFGDEYCDILGYAAAGYGAGNNERIDANDLQRCSYLPGEGFISFLLTKNEGNHKYGQVALSQMRSSTEEINKSIGKDDFAFVASQGNRSTNPYYQKLSIDPERSAACASLYGAMPVNAAFDIAAGLLSRKSQSVYLPDRNTVRRLEQNASVHCIEYAEPDEFNLYKVT